VTKGAAAEDELPASSTRLLAGARGKAVGRGGLTILLAAAAVALAYGRTGGSGLTVVQAVVTGILLGGVYGLVAMGLTLIFGVLDVINFAHGALMTVAMYVTYTLAANAGVNPYLSLVVSVPLLFAVGVLLQQGLLNRTMGKPLETQLLLTLGLALLLENGLRLGFGGDPKSVSVALGSPLRLFGAVADVSRVLAFVGAIVLAGLIFLLLRRTRLGTAIRAVASNPDGAQLVGLDVRRLYVLTFGLGTACAGAAGTLVVPFVTVEPTTGELFNILAFVVVVLGGLGSVYGALLGGLLVGLAEQLGAIYFPGQSSLLTVFIVFVLVLFLRPQGLFGSSR
jgi:branched-chain amino acid transport system permease protein